MWAFQAAAQPTTPAHHNFKETSVYLGCCHDKIPLTGCFIKNRNLFPTVLEAGKFKVKGTADLALPHMVGGMRQLWDPFSKTLI